jgi:hypothetical protein
MPRDASYLTGLTMLFDIVADMYEEHNVAAENPDVVARLLSRLQQFNTSHCALCGGALPARPSRRTKGHTCQRHQLSLNRAAMAGSVHALLEAVEG